MSDLPRRSFQVGGAVQQDGFYAARTADQELPAALAAGEFCYVLAPRQMGKSSLRARAEADLAARGVRCARVDLTLIGSSTATPGDWYFGVLQEISDSLRLPGDLADFWERYAALSPVHRFSRFLKEEILDRIAEPVVIFIDELDAVLSLPFSRDDFFAAVRAAWNLRADDRIWTRLSFCLIGVAAPGDLISDPSRTPFNVGRAIRLEDFTRAETRVFEPGLAGLGEEPDRLLDEVFAWTDGHPYMTLKACARLAAAGTGASAVGPAPARVAALMEELFLRRGRTEDANLSIAEKRMLQHPTPGFTLRMLQRYQRLLARERIEVDQTDAVQFALRLTGMAGERPEGSDGAPAVAAATPGGGRLLLRVRNRIFATVFNTPWVVEQQADRLFGDSVVQWIASGRSPDRLLRGSVLAEARAIGGASKDLGPEESAYVLASLDAERKEQEACREAEAARLRAVALRRILYSLLVLLAIAGGALWYALCEKAAADDARAASEAARAESERSRVASEEARLVSEACRAETERGHVALRAASAGSLAAQPGHGLEGLMAAMEVALDLLECGLPLPGEVGLHLAAAVSGAGISLQRFGHSDGIVRACFTPDGRRVLTASRDHTARIWDAESGESLIRLEGHSGALADVAFSPDGTRVATAGADHAVLLWDAADGAPLDYLREPRGAPVRTIAFSPDGRRLVSAGDNGSARLWTLPDGVGLHLLSGHLERINDAVFSPDGRRIATASDDHTVRLWDADAGRRLASLIGHTARVVSAAFSPDGARLCTAADDLTVRVWSVPEGEELLTLRGHSCRVYGAKYSPDGKRILSWSCDDTAILWDGATGRMEHQLKGHADEVLDAGFSPDGRRVATAGLDRTARIWDVIGGEQVAVFSGHRGAVTTAEFSSDGRRVVSGGADGDAFVWEAATGALATALPTGSAFFSATAISGDGRRVAACSLGGRTTVWEAESGRRVCRLGGSDGVLRAVAFSADGGRVATGGFDRVVTVYDVAAAAPVTRLEGAKDEVLRIGFSPDGKSLLATTADGTALLWDVASGRSPARLPCLATQNATAAFSPDGLRLAIAQEAAEIRIWKTRGLEGLPEASARVANPALGRILRLAWSPDGARLAALGSDGQVHRWSTDSLTEAPMYRPPENPGQQVDLPRDGREILTSLQDYVTVALLDARNGALIGALNLLGFASPPSILVFPDGRRILALGKAVRVLPVSVEENLALAARWGRRMPRLATLVARCEGVLRERRAAGAAGGSAGGETPGKAK